MKTDKVTGRSPGTNVSLNSNQKGKYQENGRELTGSVVAFACGAPSGLSFDEYTKAFDKITAACGRYTAGSIQIDGSVIG